MPHGVKLTASLPCKAEEVAKTREFYFGPEASGRAPALLRPNNTLLTRFDLSRLRLAVAARAGPVRRRHQRQVRRSRGQPDDVLCRPQFPRRHSRQPGAGNADRRRPAGISASGHHAADQAARRRARRPHEEARRDQPHVQNHVSKPGRLSERRRRHERPRPARAEQRQSRRRLGDFQRVPAAAQGRIEVRGGSALQRLADDRVCWRSVHSGQRPAAGDRTGRARAKRRAEPAATSTRTGAGWQDGTCRPGRQPRPADRPEHARKGARPGRRRERNRRRAARREVHPRLVPAAHDRQGPSAAFARSRCCPAAK